MVLIAIKFVTHWPDVLGWLGLETNHREGRKALSKDQRPTDKVKDNVDDISTYLCSLISIRSHGYEV